MKHNAFTLIELLVVIVIIGLLATISTATFGSTTAKARDKQRQSFVRNGQQIILASQTTGGVADYRLGANTVEGIVDNFKAELASQGYQLPIAQNNIGYYYFLQSLDITNTAAQGFMLFSCQQDKLGSTTGDARDVGFLSGNSDLLAAITSEDARAACANPPIDPTVIAGWTCINLSSGLECS